ncbi:hypothetical protein [Spiroplasma poulsonii]|uniref:hypothetical protein n=1 Tax=Spiroplasma poulsonii TaxID=2138 RepID=UPI001F4CA5A4|nr:hypothetical protein [Spiroplasma poulsonii]UNF61802.1 hypothetical protein MNU24_07780 [Spiroplasma poulsonii]
MFEIKAVNNTDGLLLFLLEQENYPQHYYKYRNLIQIINNPNYLVYKLVLNNNLVGSFILMHSGDDLEIIKLTVAAIKQSFRWPCHHNCPPYDLPPSVRFGGTKQPLQRRLTFAPTALCYREVRATAYRIHRISMHPRDIKQLEVKSIIVESEPADDLSRLDEIVRIYHQSRRHEFQPLLPNRRDERKDILIKKTLIFKSTWLVKSTG